jgi:hypothetical protein
MSENTGNKKFVLTGKAFYLQARRPNELSGKYQMDLAIDAETASKLRSIGIDVKNKGDSRGDHVTLKASAENKDGSTRSGPKVLDADKNEIPEDILVGNGSDVKVVSHVYEWKFKGKSGTSLGLDTVQVTNLIPYVSQNERLLDAN